MPDLHTLTVTRAASSIRQGKLSSAELMEALLRRGEALEPDLDVWVTLDEDAALETAHLRDRELANEGPRGPLHGVPIGVKDIYYTRGVRTTACSPILADFVPDFDSTAVAKLRSAGAIVMGKTVTTEFACGDPPPTRNPWDAARTPGGSSSGSAVGVAAGLFPAALGSQTAGSVLRPAAFNGVVGLKPTLGRISRYGVVPVAQSLDTMGHFARTVQDAALLLDVMAGHDPQDPASSDRPLEDCAASAASDASQPAPRIGIVTDFFSERASESAWRALTLLAEHIAAVASVEWVTLGADFEEMLRAHRVLMTTEGADVHRDWFAARAADYSPNVRQVIEDGIAATALDYLHAKRVQREFTHTVSATFAASDVLATPSTLAAAPRDLTTTGDPMFQTPFTFGGFPSISLPAGVSVSGMPLGVQLVAPHWNEAKLLSVAALFERVIDFRATPPL